MLIESPKKMLGGMIKKSESFLTSGQNVTSHSPALDVCSLTTDFWRPASNL
jgi:hypothetical protein